MNKTQLYKEVTLKRAKGVRIERKLCFYGTTEVLNCLKKNKHVKSWLNFISNHYIPKSCDILLIYPCSADKPYYKSRSYKHLYRTLSKLGDDRKRIHLTTISEPFGLVPEEFYDKKTSWYNWKNSWYDCPGLFEWWCKKYGRIYSEEEADECIDILSHKIALFLEKVRAKKSYGKIIAFVRTYSSNMKKTRDQTHRRMIEKASKISGVQVKLLPPQELVSRIVKENGRYAWDMYGVSHPIAQQYLLRYLRKILHESQAS